MTTSNPCMNCDGHWPPSAGVRILCIVCLMLIGGFGSAAAAASYLGPVAVVASKDGKSLSVFIGRSGVRDDDTARSCGTPRSDRFISCIGKQRGGRD